MRVAVRTAAPVLSGGPETGRSGIFEASQQAEGERPADRAPLTVKRRAATVPRDSIGKPRREESVYTGCAARVVVLTRCWRGAEGVARRLSSGPLVSTEGLKVLDDYFAWRRQ